jgi:hypothetical protein
MNLLNFISGHTVTPTEMCFYDHISQEMTGSQEKKAERFVDLGLIRYIGENTFICLPVPGYNKSTYIMRREDDGNFSCNCFYAVKRQKTCSHIMALYLAFKTKSFIDQRGG